MALPGFGMRYLEVTPPPCHEHRCHRHPRGQHRCGLIVVAGTVRAKESNGKRDGIFDDDKDKGEETRERRMGEPTGVSRVNTRGAPQEWSETPSHDVPWPHVSASHGLAEVAAIGRHGPKHRWGQKMWQRQQTKGNAGFSPMEIMRGMHWRNAGGKDVKICHGTNGLQGGTVREPHQFIGRQAH